MDSVETTTIPTTPSKTKKKSTTMSSSTAPDLELSDVSKTKTPSRSKSPSSKRDGSLNIPRPISPEDNERSIEFVEDKFFGTTRLKEDEQVNEEENIVVMKNVHKTYLLGIEGITALRGVSMTVKKGEFVCIFGTSGGGKTTMLNIMGTIDKPTKGELFIGGHKITSNTKDADLSTIRLKKIGFVFQTFNLLSSMTAQENVEMPMILAGELSPSERKQRAIELLTMVGLGKRTDHFPSMLSGGEQQRVTIARAIANKPELLLLDEPTGDLDSVNTLNVMKLLTELNKEEGITMVMVTHDVALKAYADRVIWMRDGRIQRIDITSKKAKKEAIETMKKELEIMKKRKKLKVSGTKTEVRLPQDYRTNKGFQEREIPMLTATQFQQFEEKATKSPTKNLRFLEDLIEKSTQENDEQEEPQDENESNTKREKNGSPSTKKKTKKLINV